MVTSKYERPVSVDAVNCPGTVIDLLFDVVIIDGDRNKWEVDSWTFTPASSAPCESLA
jgi:hypothetical protein